MQDKFVVTATGLFSIIYSLLNSLNNKGQAHFKHDFEREILNKHCWIKGLGLTLILTVLPG